MSTVPALNTALREEWPDADFDLPDGHVIHAARDEEEDWDLDLGLGKTGGAKLSLGSEQMSGDSQGNAFTVIRPRPASLEDDDDDDDDEGVSTIKVAALPKPVLKSSADDDFEDDFVLPSDMTRLSLAPLSLHHQSSKSSLEWGGADKDHTSSSQSSDAYSSLGFADASPSSNSTSTSSPETETDDECEEEPDLDGLVIPTDLFDSEQGGHQLTKILATKRAITANAQVHDSSPNPEDDFEMGLVIDDDVDLSPSRLLQNNSHKVSRNNIRSNSAPTHRSATGLRPPSRLRSDRAKSPINPPPTSSSRQLQKLRLSPSPPLNSPSRSQTMQTLSSAPLPPSSFLAPKPGSLRGQKSHTGLKPPSPTTRKLTRKASLSSLLEASYAPASGSGSAIASSSKARYEEPTAASRAKAHKTSMGRLSGQDYKVPPARPSTPSSNTAALRLTMPTQSRLKSRPPLSSVWNGSPNSPSFAISSYRTASPIPPRPPSSLSRPPSRPTVPPVSNAPRQMKRPKRQRTYGDGTELDGIDDLPTDRDKESRFRVVPKLHGNRVPGGTYSLKSGTLRRKGKRDLSGSGSGEAAGVLDALSTQKRLTSSSGPSPTKKKKTSSPNALSRTRKKPTLIRNLGGTGAPKVVGDMRWNPQTLRWEGNEGVLREFDAVVTSTRPALITHLTGSSLGSPVGSFASGARRVGNMIFDPARMCWISTLPPEEDEPDVFANLADDEDDDGWGTRGGTIRASLQSTGTVDSALSSRSQDSSTLDITGSPARSHSSIMSETASERGSRASVVYDVDNTFIQSCRHAEERHNTEMKGWRAALGRQDVFAEPDRSYLYDIRALATRQY